MFNLVTHGRENENTDFSQRTSLMAAHEPNGILEEIRGVIMNYKSDLRWARKQDKEDVLRPFRARFHIPKINGREALYFCGNSLGLQPKTVTRFLQQELTDWAARGVEGHFHAKRPWLRYHQQSKKSLAKLVGGKPGEVVAMNQLTVNLHLMMATFYRPTATRFKIVTEAGAFSSDMHAVESQLRLHGYDPQEAWIELKPRPGEFTLRTADVIHTLEQQGASVALVLLGAVQYYTGQFFDIQKITGAGKKIGAMVGWDLAHAIGNVPLRLHAHQVDFAVWCGYKYLNSGPGGMAGVFVHERHAQDTSLPRMAGWWGHQERERFQMKKGFRPIASVDGWQLSNFPVLSGAAQLASLVEFDKAGIRALRQKSVRLTGYLEFLLRQLPAHETAFRIITPSAKDARGCQLSILMKSKGRKVFERLSQKGIVADWREPDVIRVAPVPLYNTFEEVFRFVEIFQKGVLME